MYEHVFATALRLNEAVSFCWIEPFNGTSSHSMLHSCPGQTAGRSNLSLRVSISRLALSGHFLRARTQSGHWSPVLNWLMCKLTKSFPGDVAMKIDGGCHCGFIAYEAEADPEMTGICHCTDCQTLSGSAFRSVVPTRQGSFKLRSGEPKIYVKTAESGTKRQQALCPNLRNANLFYYDRSRTKGPQHSRGHFAPTQRICAETAVLVSFGPTLDRRPRLHPKE
jgi:hypothetical protein